MKGGLSVGVRVVFGSRNCKEYECNNVHMRWGCECICESFVYLYICIYIYFCFFSVFICFLFFLFCFYDVKIKKKINFLVREPLQRQQSRLCVMSCHVMPCAAEKTFKAQFREYCVYR